MIDAKLNCRLLSTAEAAMYCGIGVESFLNQCPVRAKRVRPGRRGLRYDVRQLDEWIDSLPAADGEHDPKPITPSDWLRTLDGPDQDSRR
jgi:hypothetical protein